MGQQLGMEWRNWADCLVSHSPAGYLEEPKRADADISFGSESVERK